MAEGRFSPEFIAETRKEALFDIFYECTFPDEEAVDERGYRALTTSENIASALIDSFVESDELKLGVDVAGGGDENVYVLRSTTTAMIVGRNRSNDTMTNVTEVLRLLEEYPNLKAEAVFIDDIGIGRGVSDRLKELGHAVNGVSAGSPAADTTRFKNTKAENYWDLSEWLRGGGRLVTADGWMQLPGIATKSPLTK